MHSYFVAALFFAGVLVSGSLACEIQAASQCATKSAEMGKAGQSGDMKKACQLFNEMMSCFDTSLDGCEGQAVKTFQPMITQMRNSQGQMCAQGAAGQGSGGCMEELMKCFKPVQAEMDKGQAGQQPDMKVVCPELAGIEACLGKIGDECKSSAAGAGMVTNVNNMKSGCAQMGGSDQAKQGKDPKYETGNESESAGKKDEGDNNGVGAVQPWALLVAALCVVLRI